MRELQKEMRFAAAGTAVLDLLVWAVSLFFTGLTLSVPAGLLLGSAGMYANLLLLRRSLLRAVRLRRANTLGGYLLRLLLAAAVITIGLLWERVNGLCTVLPYFYPKVLFGILAVKKEKK